MSQILIVSSSLPLAKVLPSGLKATAFSPYKSSPKVGPDVGIVPVVFLLRFQSLSMPSRLPLAIILPFGLTATVLIPRDAPVSILILASSLEMVGCGTATAFGEGFSTAGVGGDWLLESAIDSWLSRVLKSAYIRVPTTPKEPRRALARKRFFGLATLVNSFLR